MRFIDIDALPKDRKMTRILVSECPVIKAIPVQWIIEWSARNIEYGTLAVERMLEDWEAFTRS